MSLNGEIYINKWTRMEKDFILCKLQPIGWGLQKKH